jgi:hypothetical protein
MLRITTLNDLKKHATDGVYCYIKLENEKLVCKHIVYKADSSWSIFNNMNNDYDGYKSDVELLSTEKGLIDAIQSGSLYVETSK